MMMYKTILKPVLDRLIAIVLLVMLSPFLLVSIVLAAVSTKSNPFFVHARPGLRGKTIHVIKLKTMLPEIDENGKKRVGLERITPIGHFLRNSSLDEIPQLINVVKGDLSLVGPRPLEMRYLAHYTEEQNRRHDVLPGITGLAQVNGRNKLSWDQKFVLDIEYVNNLSFWMDCKILAKTLVTVFKSQDVNARATETMDPFA